MRSLTKLSLLALAAVLTVGTTEAAFAARKKHRTVRHDIAVNDADQRKRDFNRDLGIQYDDNGVPIIMKGFNSGSRRSASPSIPNEEQPKLRADRPIPRGSGYVPSSLVPPNVGSVPQQTPSAQIVQPYNPPKTNSFSDRVTNCIHSFPLNGGIGNNPRDQQSYIRQCANN